MNITIFGGTGKTGLLVIQKILDKGHNVTAYARTPSKIPFQYHRLKIVTGELTETNKIEAALEGCDVVISLLGPGRKSKDPVISNATKCIISAMEKNGIKRLIATATPSFKDRNDKFQFSFAVAVLLVKSLLKDTFRDIVETGNYISTSNLDWTIVRLPMLSNKPKVGNVKIGYPGDGNICLFSLTRTDLADFLVQQLDDKTLIHKAPVISN